MSIGTLYEYFPNKEALLLALAERHVLEAESGIDAALEEHKPERLLPALQQAVLASHRYPTSVIAFIADPRDHARLKRRVSALHKRTLSRLEESARAVGAPHPKLSARIVFGLLGELTSATYYEQRDDHPQLARELLALALTHFGQLRSC